MAYFGFVPLSQTLLAGQTTKTTSNALADADALPTYRVYGPSGVLGSGTMAFRDSGTITAASNATPIAITSANHGLSSGTRVTVSGVLGNTAANGTFTVTVVDANTFTLTGAAGNGAYTSGGAWHATGLYSASITADPNAGYASGQSYWMFATYSVSSVVLAELSTFSVV